MERIPLRHLQFVVDDNARSFLHCTECHTTKHVGDQLELRAQGRRRRKWTALVVGLANCGFIWRHLRCDDTQDGA
jgi:hypothetical protein